MHVEDEGKQKLLCPYDPLGNSFSTFPKARLHKLGKKSSSSDLFYGCFHWLSWMLAELLISFFAKFV